MKNRASNPEQNSGEYTKTALSQKDNSGIKDSASDHHAYSENAHKNSPFNLKSDRLDSLASNIESLSLNEGRLPPGIEENSFCQGATAKDTASDQSLFSQMTQRAIRTLSWFRGRNLSPEEELRSKNQVAQVFAALRKANIPYKGNAEIYQAVLDQPDYADKLAQGFATLIKANIPHQGNTEIYQAINYQPDYADKLAQGFVAFMNANIPYQENTLIYMALIDKAHLADTLALVFVTLVKVKPLFLDFREYKDLINIPQIAEKLVQVFAVLEKANIPDQIKAEIYIGIINQPYSFDANKLVEGFVALEKANIPYEGNARLYQAIINARYHAVNNKTSDADVLLQVLDALTQSGVSYQKHPEYFDPRLLIINDNFTLYVFNQLNGAGYSFQTHEKLFNALLTMLSTSHANYQAVLNIINQACLYAKTNTLLQKHEQGYQQQLLELESIVELNSSPLDSLTQGPLNKLEATIKIEELLEQISKTDIENNSLMSFRAPETYILKLPDQNLINLSLLIKNANLSQLTLSNQLISALGDVLKMLVGSKWENPPYRNSIIKQLQLPEAQQVALWIYTGDENYKNINKMFRSEPLESMQLHPQSDKNILAYFLLGCLLNDAANKINLLAPQMHEKALLEKIAQHHGIRMSQYLKNPPGFMSLLEKSLKIGLINDEEFQRLAIGFMFHDDLSYLYQETTLLDRGELLSEEIMKRRTANAWTFPTLTSFSNFKDGSRHFHQEGTTRTKLQGNKNHYAINPYVGEVIFSHGEQVVTTQGPGFLFSTIVRSPTLDPKNHYWSDIALEHALVNYLSKGCRDELSITQLNDNERFNYDLTHTYRVMLSIEHVINYFAHFTKDEKFRDYCQSLPDSDIEWLRVAATFSSTGSDDQYRATSVNHFIRFVEETAPRNQDMSERIQHVVRHMGDPNYESKEHGPAINDHSDETERQERNFIHRILSIAEKMDLSRHVSSNEYAQSMEILSDLSTKSDEQQHSLEEMIRYNIQLIKAHGDTLSCDIEVNGKFVDVDLEYKDIFLEASSSLKRLFEITQTVPRPLMKQPFQFRARC